jgi:hypothetical protein
MDASVGKDGALLFIIFSRILNNIFKEKNKKGGHHF